MRARGRRSPGWGLRRSLGALVLSVALGGCGTMPHWPAAGPITSPWGLRLGGGSAGLHRGVDIGLPYGSEVRAMLPGTVRFAGTMSGYGTVVWIDHDRGVVSVYGHLSELGTRVGEQVARDAVIGRSGSSGDVSGPHLHFEVWHGGREQDPVRFLGGPPPRR